MRRYETPTLAVTAEGVDFGGLDLFVTFRQGKRSITVREFDTVEYGENSVTLGVPLGQLDTGRFKEGAVEIQLNAIDRSGFRMASDIQAIEFGRQLREAVIKRG